MPKEIIYYACSFCGGFKQLKKEHTQKHEDTCFYNPKNKACLTCVYSKRRLRTLEEDELYSGFVWECKKKNIRHYRLHTAGYGIKESINVDKLNNVIGEKRLSLFFDYENTLVYPTKDCNDYEQKITLKPYKNETPIASPTWQ
jgi:hypothetical protein